MTKRNYLVTGGTGFIGSALVKNLIQNGNKVRVFDNNSRGAVDRLKDVKEDFEYIEADIRDTSKLSSSLKNIDCIIHLAYVNGTEFFYKKPDLVLDIAISGMQSVLNASKENSIDELILASSSEVYQTPPIIPTPEDVQLVIPDIMNPRYSYGGGKIACELMALHIGKKIFNKIKIFRPHNVYGPDMGWEHVLPQFSVRAIKAITEKRTGKVNFKIQGDGSQTRSFIHIDDFIKGLELIINKGQNLGIYHIGNPEEVSIIEIVDYIFDFLNREPNVIFGDLTEGSTQRRCPDIEKIIKLGFKPQIALKEGLPSLIKWYKKNINISP